MKIASISVRSIAAAVPSVVELVAECPSFKSISSERFSKVTGIYERRIAPDNIFTSDLILAASKKIANEIPGISSGLGVVVVVTQTGDNSAPGVALKIHKELDLNTSCLAFDINLGCSSFPYGLAAVASIMKTLNIKLGLLCIGDISSRLCHRFDSSTYPLFGDAGSAILLENTGGDEEIFFDLNSDGSGREDIFVEGASLSSRVSPAAVDFSFGEKTAFHMQLKGANVFSFAISKAPQSIKKLIDTYDFVPDICVLHQANKKINDYVEKSLKLESCHFPTSLRNFGNTSSVTIPLTIVTEYQGRELDNIKMIACGFGVGLSWGTVGLVAKNLRVLDLVEI